MSSIVLAGLSWQLPDGTALLDNLELIFGAERTGLVGRNGTGKTTLLRLMAGEIAPSAGTVTRPARVGVLRQSPETRPDDTLADLFDASDALDVLRRAERGEADIDELAEADWTLEARLEAALAQVGLDLTPDAPVAAMSGGQRTRAGLAALMFAEPDALLLDEPTNHLDREGRTQVAEALSGWAGCVIVASHDRELLDAMDRIVELSTLGARTYGGGYSAYRKAKAAELEAAEAGLAQAEQDVTEGQARARIAAERKARTDRQGRALRASGSQSKLVLNAARERSEGSGGASARLRTRRADQADDALQAARAAVEVLQPLAMEVPPSGLVPGRDVLTIEGLTFGYDPARPILHELSFAIRGPERIAVMGPNGAGKSTLLACIMGALEPQAGIAHLHVPAALLDQDVGLLNPQETVRDAFARIDPEATENARRAVLARFLFRGEDALRRVGDLSGGQRLRAGLACTLGHSQPRQLLLLDEPSNHLDLEATETLEAALRDYDGALLVVSHDAQFLERIEIEREVEL
jgi:ATPase subunit of ABC transporter with duplicated ATPase domains